MNSDTICAMSTAPGGALGIVRVSGPQAISIVSSLFKSATGSQLTEGKSHHASFGRMVAPSGETLDESVVTIFRSPHSYTGEDVVEISCHGSRYIIERILEVLIEKGCRQALPGEFTQRAFLNGRMDLSQAEAVADLIASTNSATHKMAMSQLRGHFSDSLGQLREQMLRLTALLELELDFSDQDVDFADRQELLAIARATDDRVQALARSFQTGKAMKEGIAVAIVGKTNVGKSTLLNRLLHEEKAIVSQIHGTTRDAIEDTTQIGGVCFRFIDTAGIRTTADEIEQIGIERTYQKLAEATIVLWIVDEQPDASMTEEMRQRCEGKGLITILNKIDKTPDLPTPFWLAALPGRHVLLSAKYGTGINELEQMIFEAANLPEVTENDVIVTRARHYEALVHAHEDLERVIEGLQMELSGDLLSEDLRSCLHHLGEITGGEITTDETLGAIFSEFCVGK